MTGEEFIETVLDHMPRATPRECREVARELRAHLEDRMEALGEEDLSPGEAGAEAMGDPAQIGKALNAQLSPFWLWLGRVAKAVCVIAALGLAYSLLYRFCEPFRYWVDVGRWGGWG